MTFFRKCTWCQGEMDITWQAVLDDYGFPYHPHCFSKYNAQPHQVDCAWCKKTLSPGKKPISHGICLKCKMEYFEPQEKVDDMPTLPPKDS